MANFRAISAVGQGIVSLLRSAKPAEFSNIEIRLFHARDFQRGIREGISVYLYRVTISGARRQLPNPPDARGFVRRPTLPLDLYYLITPWAETVEVQHVLLGWALRTIEDAPSIPAGVLNAQLPGTFHPEETVELIHDSLSAADLVNIWEINKQNMQVSSAFVARLVPLESEVFLPPDTGIVQTRVFETGEVPKP